MNRNCLIISATAKEIAPFLDYFSEHGKGSNADVLITGAGMTAVTYSLMKQLQVRRPGIIIQAGLCGSFDPTLPLGTVFAIAEDIIADLGVMENGKWKTLFDLKLSLPDQYPFSGGWLINKSELLKKAGLKKVRAISVNEITVPLEKINLYRKLYNPVVESMEGAALHYVCLMEKIPFLQLRSASNYIGERNKKKWDLKNSIVNLNHELIRLLKKI